jgi:NitT/TauT family transport system permease protein
LLPWSSAQLSSRSFRCSRTGLAAAERSVPSLRREPRARNRSLRLPAALYSDRFALVGAVVAQLVAGSGGFACGLVYRILEASFRLEMPRMFAALVLLALAGILLNYGLSALGQMILRRKGLA